MTTNRIKYCPSCGKKIHSLTQSYINYCKFCGIRLKINSLTSKCTIQCTICHEYIGLNNNNTIGCSFCGSQYHSKCITSWLQKHNTCPLCLNIYTMPEKVATSVMK